MRQLKNTQNITDRSSEVFNIYMHDLKNYPMITPEEEVELTQLIKKGGPKGERAKKRLIEANLRFVVSVANQYKQQGMELSDLINEGNIGLIKAAERFDDTRGFKFISCAVWWIRQSIIQAINDNSRTVRLPQSQIALIQRYRRLHEETMQAEQRCPTAQEFAEYAGLDTEKAEGVISSIKRSVSIDTPLSDDDNETTIGDMMTSGSVTDSDADKESLHNDIMTMLQHVLSQRECDILTRSYGFNGHEQGLDEIGASMGLSRERVRQIRERAVKKLRESGGATTLSRYLG